MLLNLIDEATTHSQRDSIEKLCCITNCRVWFNFGRLLVTTANNHEITDEIA